MAHDLTAQYSKAEDPPMLPSVFLQCHNLMNLKSITTYRKQSIVGKREIKFGCLYRVIEQLG